MRDEPPFFPNDKRVFADESETQEERILLKLYNTLSRTKEVFVPLEKDHVKMYVCGPTVYNYIHLGNARPFILFDTLRRYLEYGGYTVTYVQNFTDIDDKMINKAKAEGITVSELAERFIEEYFYDADRLNIRRATIHPKATESIPAMISMIQTLFEKGYAYDTPDGVYFDVSRMPDYGKLSRYNLEELESGGRELASDESGKRNPLDFVLWKKKKPGEPSWPSPWGEGRPGWHIECSAMAKQYLGETIDIHGGGQDLIFPHHENEIAQSEAANGKPFVRYWLHNGFVNIDQEKMSKSTGHFFTVRDLTQFYDYRVIRFFMLGGHYRMPINFSQDLLQAAENGWQRIRICMEHLQFVKDHAQNEPSGEGRKASAELDEAIEKGRADFISAMDDDINTADALSVVFELVRAANTATSIPGMDAPVLDRTISQLKTWLDVLGLDVSSDLQPTIPSDVLALVRARDQARKEKDYARADAIREEIQQKGYVVEDTPHGSKVRAL